MSLAFAERVRTAFAPPRYLAPPLAGIDLSSSGVKAVRLAETSHGLVLDAHARIRLPVGAFAEGDITDRSAVVEAIVATARAVGISAGAVGLPESKSYLFEAEATGTEKEEWRIAVEQRLSELVPLPPPETVFDLVRAGPGERGAVPVVGLGLAARIVDDTLAVFDEAGVEPLALEAETFATARALLPRGDTSTTLVLDIGRTVTKLSIVADRIPRFATTIGIGGHAFTLAVQKHFGVTEEEARRVKVEHGIAPAPGNEDFLAAMLSTVSAIRDEIYQRLEYWAAKMTQQGVHEPVSQILLVGGHASVKGLSEYLEGSLKLPVRPGDVFANFASRDRWIPPIDHADSLAFGTAIGLALRNHRSYE